MLEVTACVDGPDELTSLEVYSTVWPHDAVDRRGALIQGQYPGLHRLPRPRGWRDPGVRGRVEILTWAQRPELARGMYEVDLEIHPDIPGFEDVVLEPFEDWIAHNMQRPTDSPDATFNGYTELHT